MRKRIKLDNNVYVARRCLTSYMTLLCNVKMQVYTCRLNQWREHHGKDTMRSERPVPL